MRLAVDWRSLAWLPKSKIPTTQMGSFLQILAHPVHHWLGSKRKVIAVQKQTPKLPSLGKVKGCPPIFQAMGSFFQTCCPTRSRGWLRSAKRPPIPRMGSVTSAKSAFSSPLRSGAKAQRRLAESCRRRAGRLAQSGFAAQIQRPLAPEWVRFYKFSLSRPRVAGFDA